MRGILLVALAGLAALMAGAGASDGKVVIPGAEGEIRPVGQPGFVHEGRLYGVIPRREGNQGEITYRVNVKRSPQPRVEHILNRDVAIKWEAEGKLAIDGIGKRTQDADELLATATFKAERESQWGKAHDVRCVLSWPVAGGGGSSSQRSGMTLTGHIVAPEVKLKELSLIIARARTRATPSTWWPRLGIKNRRRWFRSTSLGARSITLSLTSPGSSRLSKRFSRSGQSSCRA